MFFTLYLYLKKYLHVITDKINLCNNIYLHYSPFSLGDDTQGNFLSNIVGNLAELLLLGHFPIENRQYISIWIIQIGCGSCVSSGCPLTATLPSNKVALCIITFTPLKSNHTYKPYPYLLNIILHNECIVPNSTFLLLLLHSI